MWLTLLCSFSNKLLMVLVYVDDTRIPGNDSSAIIQLIFNLDKQFSLKNLAEIHYFLGFEAHKSRNGLFLSQAKYIDDLLNMVGIKTCKP